MNKTTKETRKSSYEEVLKTLGERQSNILMFMKLSKKSYTARGLAQDMYKSGLIMSPERNMVHPRLNELVELGLVYIDGKTLDETMNRMVAVYKLKGD